MKRILSLLLLLVASLAGAQIGFKSVAVAPTYRLKTGIFVNTHASAMGVPQLAALGIVGVRIDPAGTLNQTQINALVANYTAAGWSASDSILWTLDHYDGPAHLGMVAEAQNAYAAGVRNFEVGNEVYNSWWSGLTPPTLPYNWARYNDLVAELRAALGPNATFYGGCIQAESAGSGFTSLGLPWSGSTEAIQCDWISRTPSINIATAHPYAYTPGQLSGQVTTWAGLCGKPCVISEYSTTVSNNVTTARDTFVALKAVTGITTVWFDGPTTDSSDKRALFLFDAGTGLYDTPTATASGIATVVGVVIPPHGG